jgi:hypothetical protein
MNSDEKPKIRVLMMLEVIGKPPEHLVETLELLIKQLGKEKGVEVKNKNIKTPIAMEKKIQIMNPEEKATSNPPGDFYTTFAEIEIDVNNISSLAYLIFRYMPAHIEILSPQSIALTDNGWNEIFNELVRRLHGYDEVARVLQVEKGILERKLKELLGKEEEDNK